MKVQDQRKKPEIITFYNTTKGAVDYMDMMTENYTVARRSNRLPLYSITFNIEYWGGKYSSYISQKQSN